eukprot:TRINITY_DN816_c0_g1_i1.p1 TRINITY_DN816_c0_g1~~TRINITY_DN816_c0_g1_i1.p1  ORF type:complete len:272 (-),score=22.34 TRINITY_DN816_c0_g1_i1:145-960(-)
MDQDETTNELSNVQIDPIAQVINFSSCWVTPQLFGIQVSEFLKPSERAYSSKAFPYIYYYEVNGLLIRYLFTIAKNNRSIPYTRYNALHLLQKCLNQTKDTDIQLTGLTCLLISSKFYDKNPVSIELLFKKSQGHYSTPQFIEKEREVLNLIDYNVHNPQFLYEKIVLYFHILTPLIPPTKLDGYYKICVDLCDLLHECPFRKFLKKYPVGLLAAATLQAGLMVATRSEGKFPATARLSALIGFHEGEIRALAKRIIKYALGKEMYEKYDM